MAACSGAGASSPSAGCGWRQGRALPDRIIDVLAVRRQLLLDNCEHVADEAAALVEASPGARRRSTCSLTRREPLRVDGEHVVLVAPLAPEAAAPCSPTGSAPGKRPDADLLAELCRRLDGLPLALELAAGRAAPSGRAACSPRWSRGVGRGPAWRPPHAAARHRSLVDLVAWSYGLLDDPQRTLFEQFTCSQARSNAPRWRPCVTTPGAARPRRPVPGRPGPGDPDRFGCWRRCGRSAGRGSPGPPPRHTAIRHARGPAASRTKSASRRGPGSPRRPPFRRPPTRSAPGTCLAVRDGPSGRVAAALGAVR